MSEQQTGSPEAYLLAQEALAGIKGAIYQVLADSPPEGLQNAQLSRALGLNMGYQGREGKDVQEGHVTRVALDLMRREGAVMQDEKNRRWRLNN